MARIIDVHHHFLTDSYLTAWKASGTFPHGLPLPQWSVEQDLAFMDRNNISAAILSLSAPGLSFLSPSELIPFARETNEFCAELVKSHPSRYGFFATLPINTTRTTGSIGDDEEKMFFSELGYALDDLGADGVTLFTSYGGKYLGDPYFRPLWQELDRRGAVAFVHPTFLSPPLLPGVSADGHNNNNNNNNNSSSSSSSSSSSNSCGAITTTTETTIPVAAAFPVPPPIIDFPHETTRAAMSLVMANIVRDFRNVKIILSHGGGTLPFLANRIANLADDAKLSKRGDEILRDAKRFYLDLALTGFDKRTIDLVAEFAGREKVLYGSDFPFGSQRTVGLQLDVIRSLPDDCFGIAHQDREGGGERGVGTSTSSTLGLAAMKLFPRLASSLQRTDV